MQTWLASMTTKPVGQKKKRAGKARESERENVPILSKLIKVRTVQGPKEERRPRGQETNVPNLSQGLIKVRTAQGPRKEKPGGEAAE